MFLKFGVKQLLKESDDNVLITSGNAFKRVWEVASNLKILQDVVPILEYVLPESSGVCNVPSECDIISLVNTGSSEGICVDSYCVTESGQRIKLGTIKTLRDDIDAYALMGKLSGVLTLLFEMYICCNYDRLCKIEHDDEPMFILEAE